MHEFMIYLSQHLLWYLPPNEYDLSAGKDTICNKEFLNDPKIPHENNYSFKLVNLNRAIKIVMLNLLFLISSVSLFSRTKKKVLEISEFSQLCIPLKDFFYEAKKRAIRIKITSRKKIFILDSKRQLDYIEEFLSKWFIEQKFSNPEIRSKAFTQHLKSFITTNKNKKNISMGVTCLSSSHADVSKRLFSIHALRSKKITAILHHGNQYTYHDPVTGHTENSFADVVVGYGEKRRIWKNNQPISGTPFTILRSSSKVLGELKINKNKSFEDVNWRMPKLLHSN